MRGICRTNVDAAGGTVRPLQEWVLIETDPAGVIGCPVDAHPPCPDVPIHCGPTMAEGETWILIDGVPVCFSGHQAACGHPTTGRDWVGVQ